MWTDFNKLGYTGGCIAQDRSPSQFTEMSSLTVAHIGIYKNQKALREPAFCPLFTFPW